MMLAVLRKVDMPPVWGGAIGLAGWLWARHLALLPAPWLLTPLGRALIAAGLALVLWAAWWFWRRRTPIEPRHTPTALITDGPFRYLRNPIYRGLSLILAGWLGTCGDASALALVPVYEWVLRRRFVAPEEATLAQTFPEAWRDWAARTPLRM